MQWEYKIEAVQWVSRNNLVELDFGPLGTDGWELVAVDGFKAYFKRPIKPSEKAEKE